MAGPARLLEVTAAVAPAEPQDGRGRRLVALRACVRGDVLLRETPLVIWGPDAYQEVLVSGGQRLSDAGEALGGFEALAATLALGKVSATARDAVRTLEGRDNEAAQVAAAAAQRLSPEQAASCSDAAEASEAGEVAWQITYAETAGIIAANAAENSDGRRALYNVLSMANHSCSPNAAWRTTNAATGEKELVCIAREIAEGEEVCITYLPERDLFSLGREARRQRLQEARSFECLCSRCAADDSDSQAKEEELVALSTKLLSGAGGGERPTDKAAAVQQCKSIGGELRRLDQLWSASSALKASLWNSYAELLADYGAPEQLTMGAAQRALEESKPCLPARAWLEQANLLQEKLKRRQAGPSPAA
eukprot:gnl/TRDRNA2_/TRDRNA2_42893_c0_seq1.p1 gnl/TRDRNA2_/TRDRNA2_42893_c0~~gnl/TRDRNA2_/TRDRNA2_42893_c0_seq1.p1  ORF type:complete len:365 (-),score=82.60 gnl/TRDRNA2_/TRDRNA2_42893_c0_seq1:140-1234(-)